MKKISVLVALALLVVAGTGYAVTCAQDNVPAATLLVPYFRVGGAGADFNAGIPDTSGTDTMVAVTNVSNIRIMTHVTVWNKYSKALLDFNVPMTPYDVYFFSVRAILNGHLNVNPFINNNTGLTPNSGTKWVTGLKGSNYDACAVAGNTPGNGFSNGFVRFLSPLGSDATAISNYQDPAFNASFKQALWTSLDESGDITEWNSPAGQYILDATNHGCDITQASPAATTGDLSGYITIDVANYCSIQFPDTTGYYDFGALATAGWGANTEVSGGPNVLFGDVFYKDQALNTGNISGDPTVALEFDSRLAWPARTFYGRFTHAVPAPTFPAAFFFNGDGREPLGIRYGFRYLQDGNGPTSSLRSWAIIFRSDIYPNDVPYTTNLCSWWMGYTTGNGAGVGFTDNVHSVTLVARDNDENTLTTGGCPSGVTCTTIPYVFLETQRMVVSSNAEIVNPAWTGGWIDLRMPGNFYEQAWVGVQHTGNGLAMSVGHSAALLNANSVCSPSLGNINLVTN